MQGTFCNIYQAGWRNFYSSTSWRESEQRSYEQRSVIEEWGKDNFALIFSWCLSLEWATSFLWWCSVASQRLLQSFLSNWVNSVLSNKTPLKASRQPVKEVTRRRGTEKRRAVWRSSCFTRENQKVKALTELVSEGETPEILCMHSKLSELEQLKHEDLRAEGRHLNKLCCA